MSLPRFDPSNASEEQWFQFAKDKAHSGFGVDNAAKRVSDQPSKGDIVKSCVWRLERTLFLNKFYAAIS